jgi:glycolate oxidase
MLERIQRIAREKDLKVGNFGHAGDGNLHPTCLTDERDTAEINRAQTAFEEMFDAAIQFGGTITGEHGVGLAKMEFLPQAVGLPAVEMMKRIKESIDPNNVLNPGKIFSLKPRCEGPLPKSQDQIKKV